jgi:hypothetical protein
MARQPVLVVVLGVPHRCDGAGPSGNPLRHCDGAWSPEAPGVALSWLKNHFGRI